MHKPIKTWKTIDAKTLLKVDPWFRIDIEKVELPDGNIIDDFYQFHWPSSSVIIPLDDNDSVITLRLYKHGVRNEVWSLPAGFLEKDEDPLIGAKRELIEETGYSSSSWKHLGSFHRDSNRGAGLVHYYLARNCTFSQNAQSGDLEEMQIHLIQLDDLITRMLTEPTKIIGSTLGVLLAERAIKSENRTKE